jgi:hypothetical protein
MSDRCGRATLLVLVVWFRKRPGADALFTSAVPGPGSPGSFYEHYGFVRTGEIFEGEIVLKSSVCLRGRARAGSGHCEGRFGYTLRPSIRAKDCSYQLERRGHRQARFSPNLKDDAARSPH